MPPWLVWMAIAPVLQLAQTQPLLRRWMQGSYSNKRTEVECQENVRRKQENRLFDSFMNHAPAVGFFPLSSSHRGCFEHVDLVSKIEMVRAIPTKLQWNITFMKISNNLNCIYSITSPPPPRQRRLWIAFMWLLHYVHVCVYGLSVLIGNLIAHIALTTHQEQTIEDRLRTVNSTSLVEG